MQMKSCFPTADQQRGIAENVAILYIRMSKRVFKDAEKKPISRDVNFLFFLFVILCLRLMFEGRFDHTLKKEMKRVFKRKYAMIEMEDSPEDVKERKIKRLKDVNYLKAETIDNRKSKKYSMKKDRQNRMRKGMEESLNKVSKPKKKRQKKPLTLEEIYV